MVSKSTMLAGDGSGERCDSWIAGRANDLGDVTIGGEPSDERVLARATADDQNSHCLNDLA